MFGRIFRIPERTQVATDADEVAEVIWQHVDSSYLSDSSRLRYSVEEKKGIDRREIIRNASVLASYAAMASAQMLHTLHCLIDQKSLILSSGSLHKRSHLLPFPNSGIPCQRRRIDRLSSPRASLKFDLSELMGGRGLCNGEAGLKRELTLEKKCEEDDATTHALEPEKEEAGDNKETSILSSFGLEEDAFEKELLGFTGGFPGGEKGLKKFIEKNPPPRKEAGARKGIPGAKPKAPDLPMLMPGMIVIVKNKDNPFYMYSGIVQRITDGKAGVLFEGGNWDRLITFELGELERREKGPPMVSPKSAVFETMAEQ